MVSYPTLRESVVTVVTPNLALSSRQEITCVSSSELMDRSLMAASVHPTLQTLKQVTQCFIYLFFSV